MTKATALRIFKETMATSADGSKFNIHERRQTWARYVDSLHRDGYITDSQVKRWTNPFPHPITVEYN
jgi:hypothetical protein